MKKKKNQKGWIAEFKAFITRGSVLDLAVGVVIGGAFTKIVNSLVNDLLMPLVGLVAPSGFEGMWFGLFPTGQLATEAFKTTNGIQINAGDTLYKAYFTYGNFIQAILNFLLIALAIFSMIKIINSLRTRAARIKEEMLKKHAEAEVPAIPVAEPAPVVIPADIALLTEIRDLLKTQEINSKGDNETFANKISN